MKILLVLLSFLSLGLSNAYLPPSQISRMSSQEYAQKVADINQYNKQLNPTILFLGDSLTEGWKFQKGWRAFNRYNAVNAGITSDRIEHLYWRINKGGNLEGILPKVIVLQIGTNNISESPLKIAMGTAYILAHLRYTFPDAKLLIYGLFPIRGHDSIVEEVNGLLGQLAKRDRRTKVVFLQLSTKHMAKDGIHLNGRGYEVWKNSLQKEIKSLVDF